MTREERIRRRKIRTRRRIIVNTVIAILVGIGCFVAGRVTASSSDIVKNLTTSEVAPECEHLFDASVIESQWCGEVTGQVRMVGGWMYEADVIQDETGELWEIDLPVNEEDFLLLWIANNNTPEVEDDVVLKVWREVH